MESLHDLSADNQRDLFQKKLIQSKGIDSGMHKSYEWTNELFKLGLHYDRGYFDCYLTPIKSPINTITLLSLLKFLNNDISFYDKELKETNLWNTLTCNQYISLIIKHYTLIQKYFENYDQSEYDKVISFIKSSE